MSDPTLEASLSLSRGPTGHVGERRISLLKAISEEGSIQAAAKRVGLSYKGAWDAVQALNNLFDRPLVAANAGGARGGTARVTPDGLAVIEVFTQAQTQANRTLGNLNTQLTAGATTSVIWHLSLRTSARNALRGTVTDICLSAVNAQVILDIGAGQTIIAVITKDSVADLGLAVGEPAVALIKSSFVTLSPDEGLRTSARNALRGIVSSRVDGVINSEVTLALAGGKTLTAVVTLASADGLDLDTGQPAVALIKASHVILAVA